MKGIVFNILEDFICSNWGEEVFEEVFSSCPLKTKEPYVGPGTYEDSDLIAIASGIAKKLDLSLDQALKSFGTFAFPKLAERFPSLVQENVSARDFLLTVDSLIHVEVKKLYPDAYTPEFKYQDLSENQLIMTYSSKRNLCVLVEGLIDGVADYFSTKIITGHTKCVSRGDSECEFDLKFADVGLRLP